MSVKISFVLFAALVLLPFIAGSAAVFAQHRPRHPTGVHHDKSACDGHRVDGCPHCATYGTDTAKCLSAFDPLSKAPGSTGLAKNCSFCKFTRTDTDSSTELSQPCCISSTASCSQSLCESHLTALHKKKQASSDPAAEKEREMFFVGQIFILIFIAISMCAISYAIPKKDRETGTTVIAP